MIFSGSGTGARSRSPESAMRSPGALRALAELGERVRIQGLEQRLHRARGCVEGRDRYDVLSDQDPGLRAAAVVKGE